MRDRAPETPARLAEEGERLYRLLANHSADVFAVFDLEGGAEEAPAVASLQAGAIDLLIADVMLARLNGAELAARLRQTRPALRTLFVVGDVGEPDPRLVLHAPEDWLVHRKFSAEGLLEKVARVLQAPAGAHSERGLG